MIRMGQKQLMLQRYFVDGKGIKPIAKELNVSKNTVKKYIKEYSEQKASIVSGGDKYEIIESMQEKPKYDTSNRKRKVITEDIIEFVQNCLDENERKALTGKAKLRQKGSDIHSDLEELGHNVSYSAVITLVRELSDKRREAFIKQHYLAGEVCEFDWGEFILTIDGKDIKYKMAVFTLAKTNTRYAYLYRNENSQCFVDAHIKAFSYFNGTPHLMVYDNMRVAVGKFVGRYEKLPTLELSQLSTYYGFNFRFCNIYAGNEKGHVERSVDYVRRIAFSGKDIFDTEAEAIERLTKSIEKMNNKTNGLEEERLGLREKMPDYSSVTKTTAKVDKWSTIVVGTNHYSVPDYLVGKRVDVNVHLNMIGVRFKDEEVARHERSYEKNQFYLDLYHYRETLKKKPGALSNSLCLKQSSFVFRDIFSSYFAGNPKEFIAMLLTFDKYSIYQVKDACNILKKNNAPITCDAIKMILMNNPDAYFDCDVEPDEIELACHRQLGRFEEMRHAV